MKRLAVGALAITLLAVSGVGAGGELKSGPQVGSKKIPAFNPLHCSGKGEGGSACLV